METLQAEFEARFGFRPAVVASAPGRGEVLGNHTDYNAGLTLSSAVGFRCRAALSRLDEPNAKVASTAFDAQYESFPLAPPLGYAPPGHWANYILGLVAALRERGCDVPGFALLVDSAVPRSAGVSSSAALEMAAATGLVELMQVDLPAIELARIGQWAESRVVGAQTGLLDQLTSLCGRRDHLLFTDFRSLKHRTLAMPTGYCFVAFDSGVKHDLTQEYNDRRRACELAAKAIGVATLREAGFEMLASSRAGMSDDAFGCATHILGENQRVEQAAAALAGGDVDRLGQLMFASHDSSRDHFRNSCVELDALVEHARQSDRCLGARLSGGGFGGISIHLTRTEDAEVYRRELGGKFSRPGSPERWSAVCEIDDGAGLG